MVSINPLVTPFPYPTSPLQNTTPLTYREGITVLGMLESLKDWIQDGVAPELFSAVEKAINEFSAGLTNAENTIIQSKEEWITRFDTFMADIVVELEGLNDEAVSNLIVNPLTQTGIALGAVLQPINDELHGRLSITEMDKFAVDDSGFNTTKVGKNTIADNVTVYTRNNEAFGSGALASLVRGRYNTAVGLDALTSLNAEAYPDGSFEGTRNTAIGSNTQRFNKIAWGNVSMGRNTLQCNVTGIDNVAIGSGAMAGNAHIGFSGLIENFLPLNITESVGVGTSVLDYASGEKITAIGYRALRNSKLSVNNTAVGHSALLNLDEHVGHTGTKKFPVTWNGCAYTITNNVLTITRAGHGLQPNFWVVTSAFTGTENQFLKVSSVTTNNFTVDTKNMVIPDSNGVVNITEYWNAQLMPQNRYNVAVGNQALGSLKGDVNGVFSSSSNTAIGLNALTNFVDGTPAALLGNSSGLGANTRVSGNNQIQLGTETETVYAFQSVQLRSDERDKTAIRDTVLGLDFVNKLRPVDYKWNTRSSYLDFDEDGKLSGTRENDGSETRSRYHHGVIAQDVEKVIIDSGVDFGGFQDHKANGGKDVMTVGYEEFIAPLIKAVQELSRQVTELKDQLNK